MLAGTRGGLCTLVSLVDLDGRNNFAVCEMLRDLLALVAFGLRGSYAELCMSDDDKARELVVCLLRRLDEEQEIGWPEFIMHELVGKGEPSCQLFLQIAHPGITGRSPGCGIGVSVDPWSFWYCSLLEPARCWCF